MSTKVYDTVIIGGGAAGLSAAVYASRGLLDFIVLEKSGIYGGQILNTEAVDNYLGFEGKSGIELAMSMKDHAEKFGVVTVTDTALSVEKTDGLWKILCEKNEYLTRTIIGAMGAAYKKLNVPGEESFIGRGVSFCAVCDGMFFKDKIVAVVGGGDIAAEEALYLSRICKRVYLIHRRDKLRANAYIAKAVTEKENIEPIWNSEVAEIKGEQTVESISLKDGRVLEVSGIFEAVGMSPQSELFDAVADRDENGFLIAGEDCKTSAEGIFAAGDIRTKALRQVVTAVADGANAASSAEKYIKLSRGE